MLTTFVTEYKIILTNSHYSRKFINLVNNIKFDSNYYYFFKIIIKTIGLIISLFLLNYFLPY